MGKINVLGFDVANLIAAGEVVERPSSVLKELIENSIDAGATSIVAEIKRGGVALIRVTDNGVGFERDDLPLALQRHATSKISGKDDLDKITTLGFRGEALAAISSVSTMTIITKTRESDTAYMLTSEAGRVIDIEEVGAADGTTVIVSDLFYNVPARRKFLKKDATEAMNVAALVEKVALSRPDISIQLLIDGTEKFKTPGDSDLFNTVRAIFGRQFAEKLIKVDAKPGNIYVKGFIGRSDNVKKNRNLMNVFINNRYVKSLTVQAAIERAYTSYIAPECFPACVLFININPSLVDVNVHPAKLEVKFADEREIFEAVYYSVKTALEDHEYRPEMTLGTKKSDAEILNPFVPIGEDTRGKQIGADISVSFKRENEGISGNKIFGTYAENVHRSEVEARYGKAIEQDRKPLNFDVDKPQRLRYNSDADLARFNKTAMTPAQSVDILQKLKEHSEHSQQTKAEDTRIPESDKVALYKYVGEAFNCYLIIEYEGDLLLIDKHAAHERVIFEDLKRSRMQDGRVASQMLMLPISVLPGDVEISCAEEFKSDIESVGFDFIINGHSCDIMAVPESISPKQAEELFLTMLDELKEGKGNPAITDATRRERALYQVACKAAIKGGRVYDRAVHEWLINKVLALPDITVCPHGRPIAYKLTKQELDRQFDRIK